MGKASAGWLASIKHEFSRAKLADARLVRRIENNMEQLAARPDHSFPKAMTGRGSLGGLYRLVNNPRVNHEQVLESHLLNTAERARKTAEVVVAHDTSTFKLPHSSVEEVGELNTGAPGYLGHFSLVLDGALERCPLGVLALETIHRDKARAKRGLAGSECAKLDNKESSRWVRAVKACEMRLRPTVRAVHVMDREADSYANYVDLLRMRSHFVIRADDRKCRFAEQDTKLTQALANQPVRAVREVPLSRRKGSTSAPKSVRGDREARMASLVVSSCTVALQRPKYLHDPVPAELRLNVVRISEPQPPVGQPPIEWILVTNQPVDTPEQMLRIVDIYRCRWVIEEFFKALKTGCLAEQRYLQDREALLMTLVLFLPIACQLLWLRSCSRTKPDESAEGLLSPVQMDVLRHFTHRKLPASPTIRQLVWAIAALGGHIKNNGEPGWQVLGRAWQRLLELELGWRAGLENSRQL
jgi:Transposase DNA-binding/Transposase DDE domain